MEERNSRRIADKEGNRPLLLHASNFRSWGGAWSSVDPTRDPAGKVLVSKVSFVDEGLAPLPVWLTCQIKKGGTNGIRRQEIIIRNDWKDLRETTRNSAEPNEQGQPMMPFQPQSHSIGFHQSTPASPHGIRDGRRARHGKKRACQYKVCDVHRESTIETHSRCGPAAVSNRNRRLVRSCCAVPPKTASSRRSLQRGAVLRGSLFVL